jgi:hypothetical protein
MQAASMALIGSGQPRSAATCPSCKSQLCGTQALAALSAARKHAQRTRNAPRARFQLDMRVHCLVRKGPSGTLSP